MTTQILDNQIIETPYEIVQLGTLQTTGPQDVINRGIELAAYLADFINDRKLYTVINNRKHVNIEGWSALGALIGVLPREVENLTRLDPDTGDWSATVELIRASDGMVIGRASASCGSDEPRWASKPRSQQRSMSITRATSKAYRLGFSWVMKLAGYDPTPLEELETNGTNHSTKPNPNTNPVTLKILNALGIDPVEDPKAALGAASKVTNRDGVPYTDIPSETLSRMHRSIKKALKQTSDPGEVIALQRKLEASQIILDSRL